MKPSFRLKFIAVSVLTLCINAIPAFANKSLCVGDHVIGVDSKSSLTIIAIQADGNFVVRDLNGYKFANIPASDLAVERGCSGNLCVDEKVIGVDSNNYLTIIAIQADGNFVVRDSNGYKYTNIPASDLAVESGCGELAGCLARMNSINDQNTSQKNYSVNQSFLHKHETHNRASIPDAAKVEAASAK